MSRRGVPQGAHGHALLLGGIRAIEQLFPGCQQELIEAGATSVDFAQDFRFFHFGVWKARHDSGLRGTLQSRAFLEHYLHRRLANFKNIQTWEGCSVEALIANPERTRIAGARVHTQNEKYELVPADLVVDAAGQGSRTPQWLSDLGYDGPETIRVPIDLGYATQLYRPPAASRDWSGLVIYPKAPDGHRSGYIFSIENNFWLVTLSGYMGDHPPGDTEGFRTFARCLAQEDIWQALQGATPISQVQRFVFREAIWRRYDRLSRFPERLIVLGDAVCRLDPAYAHGMTVAAKEAVVLGRSLSTGTIDKFQTRMYRVLIQPWLITTSEAYRHPGIRGERCLVHRLMQWFAGNIYELSAISREVHIRSFEVMHLAKWIPALLRPAILTQVIGNKCHSLFRQHLVGLNSESAATQPNRHA
jgi:2-polyprenyl-6-methoxyphenol hydroxylase-like FAD-dependent oxidoreductase